MGRLATSAAGALRRFGRRALQPRVVDPEWRMQAAMVGATLALLLFGVRVLGAEWPGKFTIFFPDSFSFLAVARKTPFSPSFYVAERPIAFPTLLFLLGRSTTVTVVVQTLLYGLAFLAAAFTAWKLLHRTEGRIVTAFLVLSIAAEPRFALWNTHILSESLGMTLAVCSVTTWWRFSADPSPRTLRWAGCATVAWLTARDSNVPPWLAVGVPALLLGSWMWRSAPPSLRKSMRRWAVVTLVVCLGVSVSQSVNGRNRYATMNNVGLRVLPDPALTSWFDDNGMPLDAALRRRTGQSSFDENWDMLTSPDLTSFRSWADGSGQRLMLLSYARFAPHWLSEMRADLPVLLGSDQHDYDAFHVARRLPAPLPAQLNGPGTPAGLLVWTLVSVIGLALAMWRRRSVQAVVLGLLLLSSFVDLYMAYVGDSVEVLRHMVGPLSRLSLVMVVVAGVGLDALMTALLGESRPDRASTDDDPAVPHPFGDVDEPPVRERVS